jgi:hypothetical protein
VRVPIVMALLLVMTGCGGHHGMRGHGEGALELGTEEMNRL